MLYIYICVFTYMYIHMHVYMHIYIDIEREVFIYKYIYIHQQHDKSVCATLLNCFQISWCLLSLHCSSSSRRMRHLAWSLVGYFGYILRNKKVNQFQSPLIWSPVTLGTGILPMPSSPYFVIRRPQTSFFSWLNLPVVGAASLKFNLRARFSVDLNTWIGAYPIFRHPDFTLFFQYIQANPHMLLVESFFLVQPPSP